VTCTNSIKEYATPPRSFDEVQRTIATALFEAWTTMDYPQLMGLKIEQQESSSSSSAATATTATSSTTTTNTAVLELQESERPPTAMTVQSGWFIGIMVVILMAMVVVMVLIVLACRRQRQRSTATKPAHNTKEDDNMNGEKRIPPRIITNTSEDDNNTFVMHDGVGGGWSPSPRSSTTSHTKHEDANKKEETGNDEDPYIIGRSQQHVQLLYTGRNIDNNHSLLTSTIDDIGMDMGSLSDAESATVSSANSCSSTNSLSSPPHRARLRHSGTASHAISMCGIVSPITTPTVPPPATAAAPCQTKLREKEEEDVERNNHNTTHHRSGTSRAIAMSGIVEV
jgi:hypothetical protein